MITRTSRYEAEGKVNGLVKLVGKNNGLNESTATSGVPKWAFLLGLSLSPCKMRQ